MNVRVWIQPGTSAAVMRAAFGRGLRKMRRIWAGVGGCMAALLVDVSHRIHIANVFVKGSAEG